MKSFIKIALLLFLFPAVAISQQTGIDTLSLKSIFYEPLLAGHRPDFVGFSPDGERILYQANDSSKIKDKLYSVAINGKDNRKADEAIEVGFSVSPDGDKVLYSHEGDIWIANPDFSDKQRIVKSKAGERDATWGPNSERITYIRKGDAWVMDIQNGR